MLILTLYIYHSNVVIVLEVLIETGRLFHIKTHSEWMKEKSRSVITCSPAQKKTSRKRRVCMQINDNLGM